jgi:EAL domain-containing protein (putative c-di-GMP-specific phosphodiesterase class I)/GGDEF domain-containing protein/CBS domain-containing protein
MPATWTQQPRRVGDLKDSIELRREVERVIRERLLRVRYQPIVDFRRRRVLAAEALTYAPDHPTLADPYALFGAAERAGCLPELELACIEMALAGAEAANVTSRIFLNLSPLALVGRVDWPAELRRLCGRHGVEPGSCVLELTERTLVEDYETIRATLAALRELGFEFAIDDLGAGYSGLRMWSEIRPEFVKIDRYFVSDIEGDSVKSGFVRSIVAMARAAGSYVIAEGVESADQCRCLLDLDVDAAQGYYFAKPAPVVPEERAVLSVMGTPSSADPVGCAEQLATEVITLDPELPIRELVALLHEHAQCDAFPVVTEHGEPLGMIWRNTFLLRYARPLQPEILNKRPVTEVMDAAPLLIEADLRLEQVSQLVTRRSRVRVTEQFIVVKDGRYLGVGQTIDLLERITQERVRVATHSNPLTLLPGNVPIADHMNRLLSQGRTFVACYLDLDNFKPFNDHYGYLKGDEVLLHVARLLQAAVARHVDFIGHVGGDDFILLMRSGDWLERLKRLVHDFEGGVRVFYSEEHRVAGGIDTEDRYGQRRQFEFLTLSVALFDTAELRVESAEEIAQRLNDIKHAAKCIRGSCLLMQRPTGQVDLLQRADPGAATLEMAAAG